MGCTMARTVCISDEEIMKARKLREQAMKAEELSKALSVLLISELGIDECKLADMLGVSERTIFLKRGAFRDKVS